MGINGINIFFFIFSLVVELLILFAFRRADINSRSVDRVRRQFDKGKEELDEIVKEKKLELNDIKHAMEGSEQEARDLIKSFESSFNMVRKRDDEIKLLKNQLDSFRSAFNDMADASQNADKNLQLLKQESRNVEIVRRNIQDLTQKLAGIKEESDSILSQFKKENEESFEQLRLNLLNTVNLNMGALQDGLEMAGKRLDTFNSQIEELTGRQALVSENAVKDLTIAMNAKLDSFKESIESFGKGYMERLDLLKDKNTAVESELFKILDTESRNRLEALRSEIEKVFMSYQTSISEKIASVDNLKNDIDALSTALIEIKSGMDDVKAKALDELSGKVKASEYLFMSSFQNRLDDMEHRTSDQLDKLEKTLKGLENLDNIDGKLAATGQQLENINKMMEFLAKTETRLNDKLRQGEETIAVLGNLVEKPDYAAVSASNLDSSARNETAKQLIQRGWSNEKIAETLDISVGEVELIREFH